MESLRRTMVVVEDDPGYKDQIHDQFSSMGYRVLTAVNQEEALALLRTGPVHLLITDLTVRGINALEFLSRVKKEHPRLPVVLMTGSGKRQRRARQTLELNVLSCLYEPFQMKQFRRIISNTLPA